MIRHPLITLMTGAMLSVACAPGTGSASDEASFSAWSGDTLPWVELRPGLSRALLVGDPTAPGPFVYRIQAPAKLDTGWHTHTSDLQATILSGRVVLESAGKQVELGPGSFMAVPAGVIHRERTLAITDMRVSGHGPSRTEPASDPNVAD